MRCWSLLMTETYTVCFLIRRHYQQDDVTMVTIITTLTTTRLQLGNDHNYGEKIKTLTPLHLYHNLSWLPHMLPLERGHNSHGCQRTWMHHICVLGVCWGDSRLSWEAVRGEFVCEHSTFFNFCFLCPTILNMTISMKNFKVARQTTDAKAPCSHKANSYVTGCRAAAVRD